MVLDHSGLDWVDELAVELCGELHEEGFVDAEAFVSVGREVAMTGEVTVRQTDGGGEAAEEEASGFQDSPEVLQHGVKVFVVAGEVEDCAAEDDVEGRVGEGHALDGFDAEVFCGQGWGERCGESPGLLDGCRVLVDGEDVVAFAEKIDEVATGAAAGIEDSHAGGNVAAEELVEEVDVDGAELLLERGHAGHSMIRDRIFVYVRSVVRQRRREWIERE